MGKRSNYVERPVGTTSGVLLPIDPYRYSFTLANPTANLLYLAFLGGTASTTSFPIINSAGQYHFTYDDYGDAVRSQVNAIFATAGATIGILIGYFYHDAPEPPT